VAYFSFCPLLEPGRGPWMQALTPTRSKPILKPYSSKRIRIRNRQGARVTTTKIVRFEGYTAPTSPVNWEHVTLLSFTRRLALPIKEEMNV
jgi:hypothetical protein